jgi:vacuole morphology and inheritance protein 14
MSLGAPVKAPGERIPTTKFPRSPTPTMSITGRQSVLSNQISRDASSPDLADNPALQRSRSGTVVDPSTTPRPSQLAEVANATNTVDDSRSQSPVASLNSQRGGNVPGVDSQSPEESPRDPFDYQLAVYELTALLDSQFVDTRVSALKWLIMLHQKVPTKVSPKLVTLHCQHGLTVPNAWECRS